MTMKHKAFHIENEWRMIVSMTDDQILDENFYSLEEDYAKPENERIYFKKIQIKIFKPNLSLSVLIMI